MRSNGVFVALVLLAHATAQTPAPTPVPDKPAGLEGAVTHATTGEPLPRVHVTLRGNANGTQREYGAMSLADGKFSITGITPGNYTVTAERTGFVMQAANSGFTLATLKADEKKSDFNLKLLPTGSLTGRVVDSEGEPVEGANVTAEGAGGNESGTTDEKGQFRVGGLAPGRYRVRAAVVSQMSGAPEIRSDGTVDMHYAVTYYPGVVTRREAGHVEVRSDGETGGVDIRLARVPWVKVSGTVSGTFRWTDHVFVTAQKEGMPGGSASSSAMITPDGSFVLWRLDPGTWYIRAGGSSPGGQYLQTGPVAVDVAASNVEGVDLRFVPNFDLAGRLEYETEEAKLLPQQRADTSNTSRPAQAAQQPKVRRTMTLRDVSVAYSQVGSVPVQDDDTFVFPKIPPGRYRIVPSWSTAWVKSTRLGGAVGDGAVIDLNGGANGGELSVMLSAASAAITGTVRDEQDKPTGTTVFLVENSADQTVTPRYAQVRSDGTYNFPNVPPGSYRIVAMHPSDMMPVARPLGAADLKDVEDLMEGLELHAGDKLTKDLTRRTPGER